VSDAARVRRFVVWDGHGTPRLALAPASSCAVGARWRRDGAHGFHGKFDAARLLQRGRDGAAVTAGLQVDTPGS
jgi:hypothetical protein